MQQCMRAMRRQRGQGMTKLHARYQGVDFTADCYFASVLGNRRGHVGWISGIVQNNVGKAGDKCEVLAGGKATETLYF